MGVGAALLIASAVTAGAAVYSAQEQAAAQKSAAKRQSAAVAKQTEAMKKIEAAQTTASLAEGTVEDQADVQIGADEDELLKKRKGRRSRIDLQGGGSQASTGTGLQL